MSLFGIGDTHLSFGKNKPMDIFSGWDSYVERLEKQWNNIRRRNKIRAENNLTVNLGLKKLSPSCPFKNEKIRAAGIEPATL